LPRFVTISTTFYDRENRRGNQIVYEIYFGKSGAPQRHRFGILAVSGFNANWIHFLSMASTAECFRAKCGSRRRPPDCMTQRFPAATPHVRQGMDDNRSLVSSFFFIRKWPPDATLICSSPNGEIVPPFCRGIEAANVAPPTPNANAKMLCSSLVYIFRASYITVYGSIRRLLFPNSGVLSTGHGTQI
jgi:hypothetical protein